MNIYDIIDDDNGEGSICSFAPLLLPHRIEPAYVYWIDSSKDGLSSIQYNTIQYNTGVLVVCIVYLCVRSIVCTKNL